MSRGSKKTSNNFIVRSFCVTEENDEFLDMVAARESELQEASISKSDILRRSIRAYQDTYQD
jgi:hypothetical protein